MDETLIIDNLQFAPYYASQVNMRNNEFFECDWCGRICQMPMEEYKTYSEEVILKSKYRCRGCARKMGRGRPRKTDTVLIEKREEVQKTPADFTVISDGVVSLKLSPEISNMVEHPPHYTAGGIECIDAIMAAVTGLTPQEAVCVANVIKYTWRFKHKNGKQDLKKAEWYLKRLTDLQEV